MILFYVMEEFILFLRKLLRKPFYSLKQFPLTINLDYKKMILKIINIVQNILFFI